MAEITESAQETWADEFGSTDEEDISESEDQTMKYFKEDGRLSGNRGFRKRVAYLTEFGHNMKEALEIANDALKFAEIRQTLQGIPIPKEVKSTKIAAAVAHAEHPVEKMTEEQIETVKSAILEKLAEIPESDTKPVLSKWNTKNNYLGVTCSDKSGFEWLEGIFKELKLWDGANLKLVTEKVLWNRVVYFSTFDHSQNKTNEEILSTIESQNEGFDATHLKIVAREDIPDTEKVKLSFLLEPRAFIILRGLKHIMQYNNEKVGLYRQHHVTGKILRLGKTFRGSFSKNKMFGNKKNSNNKQNKKNSKHNKSNYRKRNPGNSSGNSRNRNFGSGGKQGRNRNQRFSPY